MSRFSVAKEITSICADYLVADAVAPNRSPPLAIAEGIGKSIPLVRFWHFLGLQNALSGAINIAFSIS